jgi:hypothetical protein
MMSNRISALVFTLFTFCPPAPELRQNEAVMSSAVEVLKDHAILRVKPKLCTYMSHQFLFC